MTSRALHPPTSVRDGDRPVRLLGGIFSVLVLSIVAAVLKLADAAERTRIERSVLEPGRDRTAKPWTAAMAARTIDAPRIPRCDDASLDLDERCAS